MSLKRYLITMGIATLVSFASWVLALLYLDPTSGVVSVTLFFVSFFLAIFGLASIVGFLGRRIFQRRVTPFRLVAISFRQAALFGVLLTGSLFLQAHRLFTVWTALFLLVFLSLAEALFVARESSREQRRENSHGT
ncbi:MAG: hypothetical protein HY420_01635 [Candidatus Kerfeldbacteria bacterium]|nr:hypothetical protein [Candidatus Kerfeldbacteria bacterium]